MKKLFSLAMVMIMALALCVPAFAQEVNSNQGGSATITISNAAKGETYKIYKLFDATVTGKEDGSIAYTGEIPEKLSDYFTKDSAGNISATEAAKGEDGYASEGLRTALTTWVESLEEGSETATAVSDGSKLTFKNLAYGYYVITTTQGEAAISVDSTNPNATVHDKNVTKPTLEKSVNDADVNIGDTVTYTVKFTTSNYDGAGESAKQIVSYTIEDTLPEFLSNVTVTKITIGGEEYKVNGAVPQFNDNKKITIPWAKDGTSFYANNAEVVITYTAVVTDKADIDGDGNTNMVTLTWDNTDGPSDDKLEDDETIYTYAAALKKVDEEGNALAGAKFAVNGLTVTGSKGKYTVVSYDSDSTTLGTVMECDDEGNLVILGLNSDAKLVVTETEAPNGYNKLTGTVTLKPAKIEEKVTVTSTTVYYDEDGNVSESKTETSTTTITYNEKLAAAALKVENKTGVELPSTGGMGTTIFYTVGGILMAGAAILLITKKKMANEQ